MVYLLKKIPKRRPFLNEMILQRNKVMSKRHFHKLTSFWLIPFFSGSCVAFSYVTTSRTFLPKIQTATLNRDAFYREKGENLNEIIQKSEDVQLAPDALKSQSKQKFIERAGKLPNLGLFKKSQETKSEGIDQQSQANMASKTEESIFMQLFESLPEP